MCRFIAYIGPELVAEDLLYKPKYSLIMSQTTNAAEMSVSVNGDGFGVGWYAPEVDNEPCVFRSIKPAWSDQNLRNLSKKIKSPLIFAHVRAASPGMTIDELNSHPFTCGRLMFMHNGMISDFRKIRRQLLRLLNDTSYDAILGSTDSEHMFGLFLNHIEDPYGEVTCDEMVEAMKLMLEDLSRLLVEHEVKAHSYLNLCVSNGTSIVSVRYTTNSNVQPASLYYMYGKEYRSENGNSFMEPTLGKPTAIVIASEPFTLRRSDWMKVERNAMMIVDETLRIRFQSIELLVEEAMLEVV